MVSAALRVASLSAALIAPLIPATAVAAEGDGPWRVPQCTTLAAGASQVEALGYELPGLTAFGPTVEAGHGYCGPFVEASLRLRFVHTSDLFQLSPAAVVRLHSRTPEGRGFEAGLGVRLGYSYLSVTSDGPVRQAWVPPAPAWRPFDGFGIWGAIGPDARYWLDERWGLTAAADVSWGNTGQNREISVSLLSWTLTSGGVLRF